MTGKQKQDYADCITGGCIPDQETYTKEEVDYLCKSLLAWAALQVDHQLDESLVDDIPNMVKVCEYKTIEGALQDFQEGFREEFLDLSNFFMYWLTNEKI